MSLKSSIKELAREKYPDVIGGTIAFDNWCHEHGSKGETGRRRCDDLKKEGVLEPLTENGYRVYRLKVEATQQPLLITPIR